jgi:hypothetical protein
VNFEKNRELEQTLRKSLCEKSVELNELWKSMNDEWGYEDGIYRFYSQSFKVYHLQDSTVRIVEMLRSLLPGSELNPWFSKVVEEGTGKSFSMSDNSQWPEVTRPIVEAFLHARVFLDLACRYVAGPDPQPIPSGFAALLCLYQIR